MSLRRTFRVLFFEQTRREPFDLPARDDLELVLVRSADQMRRHWSAALDDAIGLKTRLKWRLLFLFRRGWLFFAVRDGRCVHFTWYGRACHAPTCEWMDPAGYAIGPCWTDRSCRGQGVYPYVLMWTMNHFIREHSASRFYIPIRPTNTPSIRGAEKAGFTATQVCEYSYWLRSPLLKRSRMLPWPLVEQGEQAGEPAAEHKA